MPVVMIPISKRVAAKLNERLPKFSDRSKELQRYIEEGLQSRENGIPIQLHLDWSQYKQANR